MAGTPETGQSTRDQKSRSDGQIGLCLSGGGFRAALFHLGALRRLNELGILSRIDTISAVSGGSIIAAHLADRITNWPDRGERIERWDQRIARPFYEVVSHNIRTGPLLRRYLLPWNWAHPETSIERLERHYRTNITRRPLRDLPDRPRILFCATEMVLGRYWISTKPHGQHDSGAVLRDDEFYAPSGWTIARGVAASTCFPPVFDPIPVDWSEKGDGDLGPEDFPSVKRLHLSDGGVFDNTGVSAIWKEYEHGTVLISSGGATFDTAWHRNLLFRAIRTASILDDRSGTMLRRYLQESFDEKRRVGSSWSIDTATEDLSKDVPGYSKPLVSQVIAEVRTDLDAFSDDEIAVLENHGYLCAEAAIRRNVPDLATVNAPLGIPHPGWMDEERVRRGLVSSNKRKILGRGWPIRTSTRRRTLAKPR